MDLNLKKTEFSTQLKAAGTQHTIFEVILLVVISALFYWFLISPKQASLNALDNQYDQLNKQQAVLADDKTKLTQAIADLHSHPAEVAEMDEALPLDNRVSKLYIALQTLTENSGMTVGDIAIAYDGSKDMSGNISLIQHPYSTARTLHKLTTTLSVTGTFDQFQALLQKLEDSGRIINITSANITATKGNQLEFSLNLESYYYAP